MPTNNALYTHVKNTSGATRFFSYLGPHGKTLADGESYAVFGDVFDTIRRGTRWDKRMSTVLEADITNNAIEIIRSPSVILFDAALANTKQLDLNNGSLRVIDPSWGAYSGAS